MTHEIARFRDWPRDPFLWVTGILIVTAALAHLPYLITEWFGSADAAWDAVVMVMWSLDSELPVDSGVFVEERFRSSPLPVYAARQLLASGTISLAGLAAWLNWLHVPITLALPIVLYRLCRPTLSRQESATATLLFLTSPIVFQLRCYGFPTLPALLCLLLAAAAVDRAARGPHLDSRWLATAAGLTSLAVMLKTDVVLIAPGVLLASAWVASPTRARLRRAAIAASLPLLALAVWHLFCSAVTPGAPDTVSSFENWSSKWTLVPAGLLKHQNQINIMMATGVGSAIAIAASLAAAPFSRRTRWALVTTLACVLPNLLFWGMREINSSRHSLWMVVPLCILIAVTLHHLLRPAWLGLAALLAIVVANYSLGPAQPGDFTAPSRWFEAARRQRVTVSRTHHNMAAAIERSEGHSRVVFPRAGSNAWIVLAALSRSETASVRVSGWDWVLDLVIDGQPRKIWLSSPLAPRRNLSKDGWVQIPLLPDT